MRSGDVSFQAHLELLEHFVARRSVVVENLEGILNAQRKPLEYQRDRAFLADLADAVFFTLPELRHLDARLRDHLEQASWADGFKPRDLPGLYNGLVEPAEMMVRAFHFWRETRWPGRAGRLRYAHTLFNLYVLRRLELLSLRLWDDGAERAAAHLSQLQGMLDRLWHDAPPDQPVFVRDARWLIQLAQSPATDDLGAYFHIAQRVADTLPEGDRLEVHRAGVRMAGGHLRSQIRYHTTKKGGPQDEHAAILSSRGTNALDFALLIQELVPLLDAYETACERGDDGTRLMLADAICQGISPDPDLFLNDVELLGAYCTIEHLFINEDARAEITLTTLGHRHRQVFNEYRTRIGRVVERLAYDCPHFRPVAGTYSPYGVLYGFTVNLIEHMAFKALQPEAVTRFSLEDVFSAETGTTDKLAWVSGWRKLPHLSPEVQALFDYPQQFAEDTFRRIELALRTRVDAPNRRSRIGRLFCTRSGQEPDAHVASLPDLPTEYVRTSDAQIAAAHKWEPCDEAQLLRDRREGKFVVSYKTAHGWTAISKTMLTDVLGTGRDVKVTDLPANAAAALQLMYPALVSIGNTIAVR